MSSSVSNSNRVHLENVHIEFQENEKHHLKVTIDTPNLRFRSVEMRDLDNYTVLHADQDVMNKYGDGTTKPHDATEQRIASWVKRWREKDPYSGLAIFEKETGEFVGHGILGHGDKAGESEAAILIMKKFWNKGYASEAMITALSHYVPKLLKKGYLVDGKPLQIIRATARPDNVASCRLLERAGMVHERDEEKYGKIRKHFALFVEEKIKPKKSETVKKLSVVKKAKEVLAKEPDEKSGMKLRSGKMCYYRTDLHSVRYRSRARL